MEITQEEGSMLEVSSGIPAWVIVPSDPFGLVLELTLVPAQCQDAFHFIFLIILDMMSEVQGLESYILARKWCIQESVEQFQCKDRVNLP